MVLPLKGVKLDQPWRGWVEALTAAMNSAATKLTSIVENNVLVVSSTGDLKDGGVQISDLATESYVDTAVIRVPAEKYITENILPEAGTEEGARLGSFRIGLLTEDDYAFFDENGKLLLYGTAGLRLITPLNHSSDSNRFAVLDASGNLKYRTAAQLLADLSGDATAAFSMNSQRVVSVLDPTANQDAATKVYVDTGLTDTGNNAQSWAAQRFITENLLDEAAPVMSPFIYS